MSITLPNWLLSTKTITPKNCSYIYKENLGKKLGIESFLGSNFIESLQELKEQIKKNNIKTYTEYTKNRKSCWPISPDKFYKDWQGYDHFFDRAPRPSFVELKRKIRACKIKTKKEYKKRRKEEGLNWPPNPERFYKEEWKGKHDFFGTLPFLSFEECQKEVKKYKINGSQQYLNKRKRKTNWPYEPKNTYKKYWKGWDHFLGIQRWLDFDECRKEIKKCKIKNPTEYIEKRKPNWPSNPKKFYKKQWKDWYHYLGIKEKIWPEFEKCREEIKKHKIKGILDYRVRRKPDWPSDPKKAYKKQWKDWYHYLNFYPFLDFEECRKEVKKYKIKSSAQYKQKRKSSWPSNPNNYYKDTGWQGYDHFLGK
jgi:hypothetical protein